MKLFVVIEEWQTEDDINDYNFEEFDDIELAIEDYTKKKNNGIQKNIYLMKNILQLEELK